MCIRQARKGQACYSIHGTELWEIRAARGIPSRVTSWPSLLRTDGLARTWNFLMLGLEIGMFGNQRAQFPSESKCRISQMENPMAESEFWFIQD